MSDTTEPAPLTEREMAELRSMYGVYQVNRAIERLRWLEAQNADLKARLDTAWGDNATNDRITDQLRAEVAALKANDPLAEMWAALAEYQPLADRDGHGESWAKMCSERTEEAAERAWWASRRVLARDEARVAARSAGAAASLHSALDAIDAIRRAKDGQR
jgi:hypothetical protein